MRHNPQRGGQWRASILLGAAGLTLAFSVIIGYAIGVMIDRHFGTTWATMAFAILGVAAGFREFMRAVAAANRAQEEEDRRRRSERGDRGADGEE